jgi:hypothetical protein
MKAMRSRYEDYQKMNMSRKQIPEMSLSEYMTAKLHR